MSVWWLLAIVQGQLGAQSIEWIGPAQCPSAEEMRQRVKPGSHVVNARVREADAHFELEVSIDGQKRTLSVPSCDEAASTTALLVDLAVRPSRQRRVTKRDEGVSFQEYRSNAYKLRFHLGAVGGAEWLLLPRPLVRFGLALQVDLPHVEMILELRSGPPIRFIGGDFPAPDSLLLHPVFDVQTGVCHLFHLRRLNAGPCVQGGVGLILASGPRDSKPVWVWNVGPALRLGLPLWSMIELQAMVVARVGPRPEYSLYGEAPLLRTRFIGLDSALGISFAW